jgi:hypothetical protein
MKSSDFRCPHAFAPRPGASWGRVTWRGKMMIKSLVMISVLFVASAAFADDDVSPVLNWGDQFVAKYGPTLHDKTPGAALNGKTIDQKPCTFTLIGSSNSHRQYWISLGTSSTGSSNPGDFTWIETPINPEPVPSGYQLEQIDVRSDRIIIRVSLNVMDPVIGHKVSAQNQLEIWSGGLGDVTRVEGSSSHWPLSSCLF